MTVISTRIFRPIRGKVATAHDRIRRLGEIMKHAGARVRVASVIWGEGVREVHLYGIFENMEAGATAATAMNADPAFPALMSESEGDPSSHWEGPEIWRCVFGDPQPGFPVLMQREYEMDRRQLKGAMSLLPEVQKLQGDSPVLALVPTISGDMARFMVVYYAKSLVEAGQRMDGLATSEAFQSILVRAAEYGKLTKARLLLTI